MVVHGARYAQGNLLELSKLGGPSLGQAVRIPFRTCSRRVEDVSPRPGKMEWWGPRMFTHKF